MLKILLHKKKFRKRDALTLQSSESGVVELGTDSLTPTASSPRGGGGRACLTHRRTGGGIRGGTRQRTRRWETAAMLGRRWESRQTWGTGSCGHPLPFGGDMAAGEDLSGAGAGQERRAGDRILPVSRRWNPSRVQSPGRSRQANQILFTGRIATPQTSHNLSGDGQLSSPATGCRSDGQTIRQGPHKIYPMVLPSHVGE
jgi:hypothetical protein